MPTTFSTKHILYTFTGAMPGGEEWQIGLRTGDAALPAAGDLDDLASAAGLAFQSMISIGVDGIAARNPSTWSYKSCTARHVSAAGITDALGSPQIFTTPGGAVVQYQPDQIAVCATLLTHKPGRSGKGRVYIPILSIAGIVNSRLTPAQAATFATDFAGFITQMNTITNVGATYGPFPICVQSRLGAGVPAAVTAVAVGDVFDTQRRRRDKLVESYSQAAV